MKSIAQFAYEREVLDLALASGGADVTFPTHGKAVSFRHRCYQFRKLFRANREDSVYERLYFPAIKPGDCVVKIRGQAAEGVVTPLGGPSLLPETSTSETEAIPAFNDPLFDFDSPEQLESEEIKRKLRNVRS